MEVLIRYLKIPLLRVLKIASFILFASAFALLFLSPTVLASTYLNVSVTPMMKPLQEPLCQCNLTVYGSIGNTTTSDIIQGINVSARVSGRNEGGWNVSNSTGVFSFNITPPSGVGEFSLIISTNSSSLHVKQIPLYISNITGGSITYVTPTPPFRRGTVFSINVTLKNGTASLTNYVPNLRVYKVDAGNVSWTGTNLTVNSGTDGVYRYNFTVPSDAAYGQYVIVVERGAFFSVFEVTSGHTLAVQTRTLNDEITPNFAPGSSVNVLAILRDGSGNPQTGATVTASVTFPNGTGTGFSLQALSGSEGFYNQTFSQTSASGTYKIKVSSTLSGTTTTTSAVFTTKAFSASLSPEKEFFFEWGGKSSFKPGQTVALSIVATNLTDQSTIQSGSMGSCGVNNLKWVDIGYANGTSINSTVTSGFFTATPFTPGTTVCKVQFTGPSTSGTYRLRVNVTIGTISEEAQGFFTVQKIFLKVNPVSSLGGLDDFVSVIAPGDNVTLGIKAVNVTNETQLDPTVITNIRFVRMVPLEFSSVRTDITTLNTSVTLAPDAATDPQIVIQTPSTSTGPSLIELQADVPGESGIRGSAFFVSNYLLGFMSPQAGGTSGEGKGMVGGEGGEMFGGFARCSGNVTFSGTSMDAKTSSAAQGVAIIGIVQAREEETGKDVSSFLSVVNSSSSDSGGRVDATVNFNPSGYTFSGNYFMVFNASYKGNTAGLPGFFFCKNLKFFPQIQAVGSTNSFGWRMASDSGLNISIFNAANMSNTLLGTQSWLTIDRIINFNPATGGMQVLFPRNQSALNASFSVTLSGGNIQSNFVSLAVYPQNFTVGGQNITKWPNGFFDLRPRVSGPNGTDTSFGGFAVVAFDAFPEGFSYGGQAAAGSVQSYVIMASTNVSRPQCNSNFTSPTNGSCPENVGGSVFMAGNSNNNTGFIVKLGRPWEGQLETLTNVNATLLSDGWNKSTDTSFERWNVTFTIPSTMKKGGTQVLIIPNNTLGDQVEVFLFTSITKYTVVVPTEEYIGDTTSPFDAHFVPWIDNGALNTSTNGQYGNTTKYNWNLTYINVTLGIRPRTNSPFNANWNGSVCIKNVVNVTRQSSGQGIGMNYSMNGTGAYNTSMLVLNNGNTGVLSTYDTVLLNHSRAQGGWNISVINMTGAQANRKLPFFNTVYLWDIEDCGFVKFANVSLAGLQTNGQFMTSVGIAPRQANKNFSVPYVVYSGQSPVASATVRVNSISKQDNRGFGFEGKLTSGQNFTSNVVTTDSNGLAFVSVNVTPSGRFMAFWRLDSGNDRDYADFSSALFLTIRKFSTSANPITPVSLGKFTLTYNKSSTWATVFPDAFGGLGATSYAFNGSVTESTADNFIPDGSPSQIWYVAFNNVTNKTVFSTASNFGGAQTTLINQSSSINNVNMEISNMVPAYVGLNNIELNSTLGNVTFLINPSSGSNYITVASATQNISARVCAETFAKPNGVPVQGAIVNVSVTDWSTYPSQTKYLSVYKIYDETQATQSSPAVLGPKGCVAIRIGPGQLGTWPSASAGRPPVFIEGTITSGSDVENLYVGDVFRP